MAKFRTRYNVIRRLMSLCLLAALISCLYMCGSGGSSGGASSSSTQAGDPGNSGTQTGSTGGSASSTPVPDGPSGSSAGGSNGGTSTTTPAGFPSSDHVFVIMLENQGFSQVFPSGGATNCSSSGMPYLCSLAAVNGVALHFYANAHGSLLDYLFATSGADWKGKPYDCSGSACSSAGVIKGDNIVRALNKASKTWRGYFEGMPQCGYTGGSAGNYTQHHNPFKWYSDVAGSLNQQDNMCPFTQLAVDLNTNTLPNFGYIVPNLRDDAEGTGSQSASALLSAADNWIKTNIKPLLSSGPFQAGGDGILIVTFDEARVKGKSGDKSSDNSCSPSQSSGCGGHVAFVMIGPNVVAGSTTSNTYHFQDMLHTMLHLLGITDYMNGANGAADIALFGE